MLHRFQDIRVEFKYPFRDIPQCYNVSGGGGSYSLEVLSDCWFRSFRGGSGGGREWGGGGVCVCVSTNYYVGYGERCVWLTQKLLPCLLRPLGVVSSLLAEISVYGILCQCLVHLCVQRGREREGGRERIMIDLLVIAGQLVIPP